MTDPLATLGVLDWGIGGIGVVHTLRAHGIRNSIIYISDTGVTPYGRIPRMQLAVRVNQVIMKLQTLGAGRVLIACHAASTVIGQLQRSVPVSGMIDPTLRALQQIDAEVIGVIGGARTIRSGLFRRGLTQPGRVILQRIAQPLSAHIESRSINTQAGQRDIARILGPLCNVNILVLACTHYPAITDQLKMHTTLARLFDPAAAVAAEFTHELAPHGGDGDLRLLTTGDPHAMRAAATHAWGRDPGRCVRIDL